MEVQIVIPVYKPTLSDLEYKSLNQVYSVLSHYPMVFIKPESLDLASIQAEYPQIQVESFDDSYFKNIQGYNRLMLSAEFYSRFLTSDYILIHQLDAYIFRDELGEWCQKGYDYIGAPWIQKPIYKFAVVRQWMKMKKRMQDKKKKAQPKEEIHDDQEAVRWLSTRKTGSVGNGGLSLRKVKSHYDEVMKLKNAVDFYMRRDTSHFNEDVFWASEPDNFSYPTVEEALKFAFDKYPALCFKENKKQLPFGCHGWYKKRARKFWKNIIGF